MENEAYVFDYQSSSTEDAMHSLAHIQSIVIFLYTQIFFNFSVSDLVVIAKVIIDLVKPSISRHTSNSDNFNGYTKKIRTSTKYSRKKTTRSTRYKRIARSSLGGVQEEELEKELEEVLEEEEVHWK